jgi:hypothetical protein
VPLTLPTELEAAFDPAARQTWDSLPIESQSGLVAFVKDGWLSRTRRRRSAIIASLCSEGAEAVAAWQAGNAQFTRAAKSVNRSTGLTMNGS